MRTTGVYISALSTIVFAGGLLSTVKPLGQERQGSDAQTSTAQKSEKKPVLVDALRVNTDQAVRSAAKEEVKKPAAEKTKESPEDAVSEFHPADPSSASPAVVVAPKKAKKGPLKDVHGTVYGSTDPKNLGTRDTGAAVGATSKSGKTSVYVETEGAHTTPPH
jgi:hypothetical protein